MSTHIRRIRAMQALLAGSPISYRAAYPTIIGELNEVSQAGKIKRNGRKQLLQVLHSTRALDTSLSELIAHYGIHVRTAALGSYLYGFSNHRVAGLSQLPLAQRNHYQYAIVNKRNFYMHCAGAFPANNAEIRTLLAEMQSCLIDVLSL